jgi:hypothetical protein
VNHTTGRGFPVGQDLETGSQTETQRRPTVAKQDYEEKYTHPDLREKIKEEIKASDKGGEKGQSQKNLEKWTEEEWQTKEGDANARKDGETQRYLPKKAWENMSEEEKEQTDRKKREGSKKGQQHVSNTDEAKQARKDAEVPLNNYDDLSVGEIEKKIQGLSKDDIEAVRDYEKNNKNRKTLLETLDAKI